MADGLKSPMVEEAPVPAQAEGEAKNPVERNIIVADDEAAVVRMMVRILAKSFPNHKVLPHENAEGAMTTVDALSSDISRELSLVVSDGSMPPSKTHGLQFYRQLRDKGLHSIPFILHSGDYNLDQELAATGANIDPLFRYARKPFPLADWEGLIKELLAVRKEITRTGLAN